MAPLYWDSLSKRMQEYAGNSLGKVWVKSDFKILILFQDFEIIILFQDSDFILFLEFQDVRF